jgi:hypothetical protein
VSHIFLSIIYEIVSGLLTRPKIRKKIKTNKGKMKKIKGMIRRALFTGCASGALRQFEMHPFCFY